MKPPIIVFKKWDVAFPRWPRLDGWLKRHQKTIIMIDLIILAGLALGIWLLWETFK